MAEFRALGELRKGSDADKKVRLFEALRVAEELGHQVVAEWQRAPHPEPENIEKDYEKRTREADSEVILFYAVMDEEKAP